MSTFQVAWNATTRVAKVQLSGASLGSGFTNIGTFHHLNDDALDEISTFESHRFYHHVRDLLYKLNPSVQDMSRVTINHPVVSIAVTPPTQTLSLAGQKTQQLATVFTPTYSSNKALTYASSDATKATVDANGKITAVAAGTTTITVTATDSGVTGTCAVTVTA